MQQTEKYKLNLIESSDPFLPEGLNQNTQKVEDAMIAHEEKVKGSLDAFGARVTALEARRFFVGTYTGTGEPTVDLGFTPLAILVFFGDPTRFYFTCAGASESSSLSIMENGIRGGSCGAMSNLSTKGSVYTFLAFV